METQTDAGDKIQTDTIEYKRYQHALAGVYPYRAALDESITLNNRFMDVLNENWQADLTHRFGIRRGIFDWTNQSIAFEFGAELPGRYLGFDSKRFLKWIDMWQDQGPYHTIRSMSLHGMLYHGMSVEVFTSMMANHMHNFDYYFGLIHILNVLTNIELAWGDEYSRYIPNPSESYSFRYTQFFHPESGFGPLYGKKELKQAHLMKPLGNNGLYPYSFYTKENNTTYLVFADYDLTELTPSDVVIAHLTKNI